MMLKKSMYMSLSVLMLHAGFLHAKNVKSPTDRQQKIVWNVAKLCAGSYVAYQGLKHSRVSVDVLNNFIRNIGHKNGNSLATTTKHCAISSALLIAGVQTIKNGYNELKKTLARP